jgi:hypothetical protein
MRPFSRCNSLHNVYDKLQLGGRCDVQLYLRSKQH